MSDLRIRSEQAPEQPWPVRFQPPPAAPVEPPTHAMARALAAGLARLFGEPVQVLPATPEEAEAFDGVPGAALAGLLLARRLGGGTAAGPARPTGVVWQRLRAAMLAELAAGLPPWPAGLAVLRVHATLGGVHDLLELAPPCGVVAPAPADPRLGAWLAALDLPVRVELASADVALAGLWPLAVGCVLPLQALAEARLRLGDRVIGAATLEALADGRQAATITAIEVNSMGEQA